MTYSDRIQKVLKKEKVEPGDKVAVEGGGKKYEGILMPRSDNGDCECLVVKLDNGYNVGIEFSEDLSMDKLEGGEDFNKKEVDISEIVKACEVPEPDEKPEVSILAAGGTIASKVDYRTGAVKPSFTEEEIVSFTPEISSLADIDGRELFQELSENLTPDHWKEIAEAVKEEVEKGKDGVVIMHGTDTMSHTAVALSFMLEDLPVPVVLVGSQRSSDRGSSDAHQNLTCAVRAAGSGMAEVMVCMHGESSDTYCYLHPGVKVRKMHTSRRDAFRTINAEPFARVDWETLEIEEIRDDYRRKNKDRELELRKGFEDDVAFIKSYPGISAEDLKKQLRGKEGAVLEGTGLGHIPIKGQGSDIREVLRDFTEKGIAVMSSQCLYGRVNMNVYETGADLKKLGVLGNFSDMLPEVTWIKLSWLLGNYSKEEAKELIEEDLRGEISERTEHDEF